MENNKDIVTVTNLDSTNVDATPVVDSTNPSEDKNAVFFEKFEKSKKDFLKEKRKDKLNAKKSIVSRNKMMGLESRLREEDYLKKIWIIFIVVGLLLLAYASVVMGFLGNKFNGVTDNKWIYASYFSGMTKTSVIFSGIAISLIPLPYLYLLSAWFIGINSVHQSRYFILTNMIFLIISGILLLIVIPMSSFIFNQTIGFEPIPSAS